MLTNTFTMEILDSIDNITESEFESEMAVLSAMVDVYHKASIISENYKGDNLSQFEIVMEAGTSDETTPKTQKKYTSSNILSGIFRWFKKIIYSMSLKLLNFRFDLVINKIKQSPKDSKFTMHGGYYTDFVEIYEYLDKMVNYIYDFINNTSDGYSDFNLDIIIDNHKLRMVDIKSLGKKIHEEGTSMSFPRDNILSIAEKEQKNLNKVTPSIKELMSSLDKLIKVDIDIKDSELITNIRKSSECLAKEYITIITAILKQLNAVANSEIVKSKSSD